MNAEQISFFGNVAALIAVSMLWFVFLGAILLRKRPPSPPDAKREPRSWIGLGLQCLGYVIAWSLHRTPFFSPFIAGQFLLSTVLSIVAIVLAIVSLWFAVAAIRELGRQWSLTARVTEDHKLVTTGIYNHVRHPIYTAMLGMLVATGIVSSHWVGLLLGLLIFLIGTAIRIRFEEKLLGDAFGDEFSDWKKRVPGLIPRRII